eukprot:TRINITY_DN22196_c0_g1_i1.p1 TRINITY_DN22196_c0_g1~~TRINITY_DN22196_c0_g1_i1.p1  ORF type:complete len:724 (-),score=105.13 TRINITY_DN22196_c0_g1_i1:103-2235(-)
MVVLEAGNSMNDRVHAIIGKAIGNSMEQLRTELYEHLVACIEERSRFDSKCELDAHLPNGDDYVAHSPSDTSVDVAQSMGIVVNEIAEVVGKDNSEFGVKDSGTNEQEECETPTYHKDLSMQSRLTSSADGRMFCLDLQFDRFMSLTNVAACDEIYPIVIRNILAESMHTSPVMFTDLERAIHYLTTRDKSGKRKSRTTSSLLKSLSSRKDMRSYHVSLDRYSFYELMQRFESIAVDDDDIASDLSALRTLFLEEADFHAREVLLHKLKTGTRRPRTSFASVELIPAFVILANSIALGLSQDVGSGHIVWEILEMSFFAFYVAEFLYKLRYLGCLRFFHNGSTWDYWNWFDVACLIASVLDLSITWAVDNASGDSNSLMLLKIFRVARLARLIRTINNPMFNELKLMLLGILAGLRTLFWAFVLLVICIYILGVAMRIFMGESVPEFRSVPAAMFSLFRCFTDGCSSYDGTPLSERMHKDLGALFMIAYVVVIMLVTMGIFNLITAVFIDNASISQSRRRQDSLARTHDATRERLQKLISKLVIQYNKSTADQKVTSALVVADPNSAEDIFELLASAGLEVTRDMFLQWASEPDFLEILEESDIDSKNSKDLFDALDADVNGALSLPELVNGLMMLRGPVNKTDIAMIAIKVRFVCGLVTEIFDSIVQVDHKTKALNREVASMREDARVSVLAMRSTSYPSTAGRRSILT